MRDCLKNKIYMKKLNIAIIGGGLMGGSLAYVLNKKNHKIVIILKDKKQLEKTLQQKSTTDYNDLKIADLIFIATPLKTYQDIFIKISDMNLKKDVIICDLGSVKNTIMTIAEEFLGDYTNSFVASHPIAGSHISGIGAIKKNLYQNKKLIITSKKNDKTQIIAKFFKSISMHIEYLDSKAHDKIYGLISHLPQKLAFFFFEKNFDNNQKKLDVSCETLKKDFPNYQNFIRLCYSNQKIWQDIFAFNNFLEFDIFFKQLKIEQKTTIETAQYLSQFLKNYVTSKLSEEQINNYAGTGYKSMISLAD